MLAQSIESQKAHIPTTFNWTRLLSFFICNTLYVGPFLHFWWEQLWKLGRWMQETHGARKRSTILVQLLIDQTIGVIVFFPTYFYAYEMAESLLLWKSE
jgi:protein Mpv17